MICSDPCWAGQGSAPAVAPSPGISTLCEDNRDAHIGPFALGDYPLDTDTNGYPQEPLVTTRCPGQRCSALHGIIGLVAMM